MWKSPSACGAGYGSREFACRDPEGNLWSSGTYQPDTSNGEEA